MIWVLAIYCLCDPYAIMDSMIFEGIITHVVSRLYGFPNCLGDAARNMHLCIACWYCSVLCAVCSVLYMCAVCCSWSCSHVIVFHPQHREVVTWGLWGEYSPAPPSHLVDWRSTSMAGGGLYVTTFGIWQIQMWLVVSWDFLVQSAHSMSPAVQYQGELFFNVQTIGGI